MSGLFYFLLSFNFVFAKECWQPDPFLGEIPVPGCEYVTKAGKIRFNKLGLRDKDPTPAQGKRILFLGTALTNDQLTDSDLPIQALENYTLKRLLFDADVIDGNIQEHYLVKNAFRFPELIKAYKPDLAIYFLSNSLLANDIMEILGEKKDSDGKLKRVDLSYWNDPNSLWSGIDRINGERGGHSLLQISNFNKLLREQNDRKVFDRILEKLTLMQTEAARFNIPFVVFFSPGEVDFNKHKREDSILAKLAFFGLKAPWDLQISEQIEKLESSPFTTIVFPKDTLSMYQSEFLIAFDKRHFNYQGSERWAFIMMKRVQRVYAERQSLRKPRRTNN